MTVTTEKTHIGGFELNLTAKQKMRSGTIESDTPFCVAILGDFSNRANKASSLSTSFGKQCIFEIDRDNFDDVIKSLAIRIQLQSFKATSSTIDFPITELEDFHPDQLYQHVGFFDKLRDLRKKLLDPATFNAAADEVSSWFSGKEEIITDTDDNSHNTDSQSSLLDAVISSSEHNAAQIKTTTGSELVDELIKEAIADYRIPAVDARQQEFVAAVDEAIAAQMRYILHHPQFQNIEAAWKAVYFLVRRLETGSRLKLFLIDIPKNELREDLSCNDLENTQLYKLLCDSPTGNIDWSLLMGNYTFSANMDDVHLLGKIGYIAQSAQTSFVAGADPSLIHCTSFGEQNDPDDWQQPISDEVEQAWQTLRGNPVANHIALALPRFLLRMPYGKKFSPIESYDFDEMPAQAGHEYYLWGNAAYAITYLLAQAFVKSGWKMQPGELYQIDDLPLYYYEEAGELVLKPCAEIIMTERANTIISKQGLIPLWSIPGRDSVRISTFRSLAQSGDLIAGPWAYTQ